MPAELTTAVAVVVKDRRDRMAKCLEGIDQLTRRPDRIVIVDNGSTDGTWELLQQHAAERPAMTIERRDGPIGVVRNRAAALAATDIVAFTDSDCIPEPDWLGAIVQPFDSRNGRELTTVQGKTLPTDEPDRRWSVTQRITGWSGLFEACNIAYRTRALLASGGFGEEIGFFGEDTVAGLRVTRNGGGHAFADDAIVRHDVTYPGMTWHLRRGVGYRNWPTLTAEFPELRDLMWHRVCLTRRTAEFDAAVTGLLAAAVTRRMAPLLLVGPYAARIAAAKPTTKAEALDQAAGIAFDAARAFGLMTGSVQHRTLVL